MDIHGKEGIMINERMKQLMQDMNIDIYDIFAYYANVNRTCDGCPLYEQCRTLDYVNSYNGCYARWYNYLKGESDGKT